MIIKKKEIFKRKKEHCNIGTIGHVDHGKTTLTAAITKVLLKEDENNKFVAYEKIDKHKEERVRGITIESSHIEYYTKKRHYTHIDCPGHQDYIKNMITGVTQMDGAILVVSVVEGPQEQTREHIILAKEIGIKNIVVYLNKMDVVKEQEIVEMVKIEIEEMLNFYGFKDCPIILGSAREALEEKEITNLGWNSVKKLMEEVDRFIKMPFRDLLSSFLMPIDSVIIKKGRGIVVTGTIKRGKIKIGEELEIVGKKVIKVICMSLEIFRKDLFYAEAGETVGILLKNLTSDDKKRGFVKRGYVLATKNSIKSWDIFFAKAYALTYEEGGRRKAFMSNYKPQFFFRNLNVTGAIKLEREEDMVKPGDIFYFTVFLLLKVPLEKDIRFTIREGNITVGAGVILDLKK